MNRSLAALAAVLVLGTALKASLLDVDDYMPKADEGYYLRYASAVAGGRATPAGLVDEFLSHEKWQRFPSPLRAGHILLSAAWLRLLGRSDFAALSALSCVFAVGTLALAALAARGLFGRGPGLAAAALLAASPLQLLLGRRAYQDAVVEAFVLTSLLAFYACLRPPPSERARPWLAPALLAAAFAMAMLLKESSVLLLAFFLPWLALENRRGRPGAAAALLAALAAAGTGWLWVCGGPSKLWRLASLVVSSPAANRYALRHQAGGPLRYLEDFALASPWVLAAALYALGPLARGRLAGGSRARFFAAFAAAQYAAFSLFARNLRYVAALDATLRLLAVLGLWRLTARSVPGRRARAAARVLAVAALAAADLLVFARVFLDGRVYDPVTADLLDGWAGWLGLARD